MINSKLATLLVLFMLINSTCGLAAEEYEYIYDTELLMDTGFESKEAGVSSVGGSSQTWRPYYSFDTAYAEIIDTDSHSGSNSIRFVNAGNGNDRGIYYIPTIINNGRAGDIYEFSGWFKTDNDAGAKIYIRSGWNNFDGSPAEVGNEWRQVKARFIVPEDGAKCELQLATNLKMKYTLSEFSNDYTAYQNAITTDANVAFVYADDISFRRILDEAVSAKSIVSRGGVTAVIDYKDRLWMWGDNSSRQISSDTEDYFEEPCFVMENVKKVVTGGEHTIILTEDGKMYGRGNNDFCEISNQRGGYIDEPYLMMENVKDIAAGSDFTVAVNYNDELYARGRGMFGSFGTGNDAYEWTKVYSGVKSVEASGAQTFIITNNGDLYGTGYNLNGQLGVGNHLSQYRFTKIMADVVSVSSDSDYTLAVNSLNELYGFGWNKYGCLGNVITDTTIPVKIADDIRYAGAGEKAAFIIKTDGTLLKLGGGKQGLFNGTDSVLDILANGVILVSGNDDALLLQNGTLLCYDGDFTQLELPTTENETYRIVYCGNEGGSINIKIPALRNAEEVVMIAAFYKDGRLISVQQKYIVPKNDCEVAVTPKEESDSCTIMLWNNMNNITPKADAINIPLG